MRNKELFELISFDGASRGYSETELNKIEKLYDVYIRCELRDFMLLAGRSAGHMLGDDFSLMYSPAMSVRDHLLYQEGRRKIISEDMGCSHLVVEKPFFFAEKMQAYLFFVKTNPLSVLDENKVFCLNENFDHITEEQLPFSEFILREIYARRLSPPKRDVICVGEMVEI